MEAHKCNMHFGCNQVLSAHSQIIQQFCFHTVGHDCTNNMVYSCRNCHACCVTNPYIMCLSQSLLHNRSRWVMRSNVWGIRRMGTFYTQILIFRSQFCVEEGTFSFPQPRNSQPSIYQRMNPCAKVKESMGLLFSTLQGLFC